MVENTNWLKRTALQFITENDFQKIERKSAELKFRKGEVILKQDNQPTHIAFLKSGIVKFNYENKDEKNIILSVVSAPKILGGANLFYKDRNLFSIVAVEDCDVILMDSDVLLEQLRNNGKFAVALYQIGSEMFKKSVINFISLANKQKEGRIADIIIYLAEEVYHGNSFNLSLTRKELAEFACCASENLITTLTKWQNEKIIESDKKQFSILDMDKLKLISRIG